MSGTPGAQNCAAWASSPARSRRSSRCTPVTAARRTSAGRSARGTRTPDGERAARPGRDAAADGAALERVRLAPARRGVAGPPGPLAGRPAVPLLRVAEHLVELLRGFP